MHQVFGNDTQEFDAIVHSTGMLVLRAWLVNAGAPATNPRLKRLKHLIGLAPATWGSPQAHKGRTWLGALVKGNRQLGPDFLNAGDRVLEGLELGSKFTWDLAHQDLLGPEPFYDNGPDTPYVTVFIGNTPYDGLASVANDPGTDGTVRWSGCSLNARKITIDLTRVPVANASRLSITPWASDRLDIPMIPVDGRNHGTLISDPDPGMVDLVADFLKVGEPGGEAARRLAGQGPEIRRNGTAENDYQSRSRRRWIGRRREEVFRPHPGPQRLRGAGRLAAVRGIRQRFTRRRRERLHDRGPDAAGGRRVGAFPRDVHRRACLWSRFQLPLLPCAAAGGTFQRQLSNYAPASMRHPARSCWPFRATAARPQPSSAPPWNR